jgi:hypothetical protein
MLAVSVVDGRFKPKTITSVFAVTLLSTQHYTGLAQNQDNVSEWNDMSTRRLLFE